MDFAAFFVMDARRITTVTFNSSTTWVAPPGVTLLTTASGYGAAGTASNVITLDYAMITVTFRTDASTGAGNFDWTTESNYVDGVVADMNADGAASWTQYFIDVWPDGTNTITSTHPVSDSGNIAGSAYRTGPASGPATQTDRIDMYVSYDAGGTSGAVSTAFSLSFPGGTPAVPTPSATTYNNVAVVPGTSYPIVVASGGAVTITFRQ